MQSSQLPAHSPVCGHQVCKLGCASPAVAAQVLPPGACSINSFESHLQELKTPSTHPFGGRESRLSLGGEGESCLQGPRGRGVLKVQGWEAGRQEHGRGGRVTVAGGLGAVRSRHLLAGARGRGEMKPVALPWLPSSQRGQDRAREHPWRGDGPHLAHPQPQAPLGHLLQLQPDCPTGTQAEEAQGPRGRHLRLNMLLWVILRPSHLLRFADSLQLGEK